MTLPRTNRSLVTVALAAGLLALGACTSSTPNTRVADRDTDVVDETPPEISHEHDATPQTFGEAVFIGADVTDDSAIVDVKIVFQRETDGNEWTELRMAPVAEPYYEGTIPGREVSSGGIRYYIEAEDAAGNVGCLPDACAQEPWHFPVVPPRD